MNLNVPITFFLMLSACGATAAGTPASRYVEPYPIAASKKGLQVEMVEDALKLGVKHSALNINLSALIDPAGDHQNPSWRSEGKTYHFRRAYLSQIDSQIRAMYENGMLVNLIAIP